MKKYISTLFVLVSGFVFSQTILNAKSPSDFRKMRDENVKIVGDTVISNKITPLSYGYVDERDIIKSVYVWEVIDLNDKVNQPFYYDNADSFSLQNKSLYTVLLQSALSDKFTEVYDDEMFLSRLDPAAIPDRVRFVSISDAGIEKINEQGSPLTPEQEKEYTDIHEVKSENVKLIKIKGMWYIDRRDGQMKYRLIGIAAMGQDPTTMGQVGPDGMPIAGDDSFIDLFWLYYPDAREVLANSVVFNSKNISSDITYDDILNARRFSTIIYKSENGLGNGVIKDYIPNDAEGQLEESDRIKAQILQMENDMWNY